MLTLRRYARRHKGLKSYSNVLGIRADERNRLMKGLMGDCALVYPLAMAGIRKADVEAFWKAHPFDLEIPSELSNCTLCFLKGKNQLKRLIKQYPDMADWWIKQEELTGGRFIKGERYKSLKKQRGFVMEVAEEKLDCFCGD